MVEHKDVKSDCVMGNVNQSRIAELETKFDKMAASIQRIEERLLGRPTWFVTLIFSSMFSMIVSLILFIVTKR